MSFFTVAIIGKTNVGKSTLFNLLSKKKLAIVANTPSVTVDYKENIINFHDLPIKIVDTGGITSHTKKAYQEFKKDIINKEINIQTETAIKLANLVLLVVDAKEGLTYEDTEIALKLRKSNKNTIIVVNKVDNKVSLLETHQLGFKHIVEISALHKLGIQNLYNSIKSFYTIYKEQNINILNNIEEAPFLSISFVGKPNSGKSTLINSLLQKKRLAVSEIPGTTTDSVSVYFTYKNKMIRIIDTAGLSRKSKMKHGIDVLTKKETIRSINFSHVVILVVDATLGITKQDLTLASYILQEGRAIIILLNKIDLINNIHKYKNEITTLLNENFSNIKGIKIIATSGLKSINLNSILQESLMIYNKWSTTIKTSLLNKWISNVLINNPPPLHNGKLVKIKFVSQNKTRPPTFNLWVNLNISIPNSYLNFLRNQLYKTFDLYGVPIRFNIKTTKNPYIKDKNTK